MSPSALHCRRSFHVELADFGGHRAGSTSCRSIRFDPGSAIQGCKGDDGGRTAAPGPYAHCAHHGWFSLGADRRVDDGASGTWPSEDLGDAPSCWYACIATTRLGVDASCWTHFCTARAAERASTRNAEYPNRRWSTDMTTVWTRREGWVAVTPVIDNGCRSLFAIGVAKSQPRKQ